jgi:soluble epoxide hydrolase / lipid-phosphate phosphatase
MLRFHLTLLRRMSVPYTPPAKEYMPLTEVAKRAPNLGYQLYFAEQKSSHEILAHVGHLWLRVRQ